MSSFSLLSWNVRSKAPTRRAESRVFLLTEVLFLNNELAGLASGILLRRYLTKKSQPSPNTRMATTRQMMARPQPGIGWSGVTAVVITVELVELELGLVLHVVVVVLNTVVADVVTMVVVVVEVEVVVVVVEDVADVNVDVVVVVVVVGILEVEDELSSVFVESLLRIGTGLVSSVSFSPGCFIVTELSIGLP